MYNLIRYFNQNRKRILIIILIIVLILGGIRLLNTFSKTNRVRNSDKVEEMINTQNMSNAITSDKSIISGQNVSKSELKKNTDVIDEFIKYCNEKDINSAYALLSEECKEVMFPTIENFNNIYIANLFDEYKTYTIENWNENTYQVKFTGDILATGNIKNAETKQDYITVVKNNEDTKLNINNYIKRKTSNKETEYKNIKATIKSIDTYFDYEVYNLEVKNDSKDTILLDTSDDAKSIYLLDKKDMKYYFYSNEIVKNKLMIKSQFTSDMSIKFNNSYSSSRTITNIVFSKMILNYDEYKELEDKEDYQYDQFVINV